LLIFVGMNQVKGNTMLFILIEHIGQSAEVSYLCNASSPTEAKAIAGLPDKNVSCFAYTTEAVTMLLLAPGRFLVQGQ